MSLNKIFPDKMIRPAEKKDIMAINRIYNQAIVMGKTAHTEPLDLDVTEEWLTKHEPEHYPVYVMEKNNEVVGWISFSPYREGRQALRHTAEISFYVEASQQRSGIGRTLIGHAMNVSARFGFSVLIAFILETNIASISLMEKMAFEKWGLLPEVARFNKDVCGHVLMGKVLSDIKNVGE